MNGPSVNTVGAASVLIKADPNLPAIFVTGRETPFIRAGISFAGRIFSEDTPLPPPDGGFEPGVDYAAMVSPHALDLVKVKVAGLADDRQLGGFHFAPGGNASARRGGDAIPAINPFSAWDLKFRPTCSDTRGLTLVQSLIGLSWIDIYMLGKNHLNDGTSKFGVTIADGNDPPQKPSGGYFKKLDYDVAVAVMTHHGKTLQSFFDFIAGAFGVTEKTACGSDPCITGLDAPRTSQRGVMQVAGNLWTWGHDGDPDSPRASLFGGAWANGANSGSRASFWNYAPSPSYDAFGARGRCDHLQLV